MKKRTIAISILLILFTGSFNSLSPQTIQDEKKKQSFKTGFYYGLTRFIIMTYKPGDERIKSIFFNITINNKSVSVFNLQRCLVEFNAIAKDTNDQQLKYFVNQVIRYVENKISDDDRARMPKLFYYFNNVSDPYFNLGYKTAKLYACLVFMSSTDNTQNIESVRQSATLEFHNNMENLTLFGLNDRVYPEMLNRIRGIYIKGEDEKALVNAILSMIIYSFDIREP